MRERERRRVVRKKFHWGRIVLVLLFFCAIGGVVWGVAKVYMWLRWYQETTVPAERRVDVWSGNVTVLLLGYGPPAKAKEELDAVMLLSFGFDGRMTVLPLPREMLLPLPEGKVATGQEIDQKLGHLAVRDAIERWLDRPVHFYIAIPADAWLQLIDISGGLDLYVERDMHYEDPYDGTTIHLNRGVQKFNGKETLDYLRYRSDELGDVHRLQRQQRIAQALGNKIFSYASINRIGYYKAWYEQRVETDLFLRDAAILAWRGFRRTGGSFQTAVLPGEFKTTVQGLRWTVPSEKIQRWLGEVFPNG